MSPAGEESSTSAIFAAEAGHTYGFYSVATDHAGHTQPTPAGAQANVAVLGSAMTLRLNAPTST